MNSPLHFSAFAGCVRASPALFFLFHLLRPFPLGLRSLHSTADVAFILLLPGIKLNFGCVHLLSCRARAVRLPSHPYPASPLPASLLISSPGTCGLLLPLDLPVNIKQSIPFI